jgi:putative transposase
MGSKRLKIAKQLELELPTWGGARKGAGRKRRSERATVPHVVRADVRAYNPVLVTIRVRNDVPDLRQPSAWAAIVRTFRAVRGRTSIRFVHYSVQREHMHQLAESSGREGLALGMQTFCTRFAKSINRCFGRRGPVLAGRYHARELATPTEVRNAIHYVLSNARHHAAQRGTVLPRGWIDPRSTAAIFDGWRQPPVTEHRFADYGTSPAQTWLLREGWRRLGLLDVDAVPGKHHAATGMSSVRAA